MPFEIKIMINDQTHDDEEESWTEPNAIQDNDHDDNVDDNEWQWELTSSSWSKALKTS